jgi:hypothetical protein
MNVFTVTALTLFAASKQTAGPSLSIDFIVNRHRINPDIYGMNDNTGSVDVGLAKELKLPAARWGGDATTRYNWLNDGTNAGFDWYFMAGSGNANPVPGASSEAFIDRAKVNGTKAVLTVPIIDYINSATNWDCSFPVSIFGAQQSVNPYVHPIVNGAQTDAGNSISSAGQQLTLTNSQILRIHVPNSTALAQGWVKHLVSKYGKASANGVPIYQLDNEPSGWANTHRDIHPVAPTYQEILQKSEAYALAIKQADPSASVLGPSDFGWPAYVGTPSLNGGLWNAPYYLQQMAATSASQKVRLLDYFDEHYYPTSDNGVGAIANSPAGDAATQANRIRSTRSLWDPTYVENDWIGQYYGAIYLIPRMRAWISTYYPGTKLAITEYNFGAPESINGAITQADALGIFGREGVDLATVWGPPTPTQPAAFAFRMFRNFDGKGGQFGDYSYLSTSADQSQLAIYGSNRSYDNVMTVMVINKTAQDLRSTLAISHCRAPKNVAVYSYSSANLATIVRGNNLNGSAQGLTATFPADSITLLVW